MTTLHWGHIAITGLPSGVGSHPVVIAVELLLFGYFVAVNVVDFTLIAVAALQLPRFMKLSRASLLERIVHRYAMPVSVIVPVFNEAPHVREVLRSIRASTYPSFEVLLVNDGSTDETLDILKRELQLVPLEGTGYVGIVTQRIRAVYRSKTDPRIRLIDKENGGKGDALNAGLNLARFPLVFVGDGDSIYMPEALDQMMQPFAEDPRTVGCGAALRILNGREIVDGIPTREKISSNLLVRFQIIEYLRAALSSRFASVPINGLMSISGACALWKKDVLVGAGGYATNTVWEDAEMTVRVHHYLRAMRKPYRIAFVPAGVCWTMVPETLADLRRQRVSWQRHITETIMKHRNMLFRPRMGLVGSFAFPAYVLNEWLAPMWLLAGAAFIVVAGFLKILSVEAQLALLAIVFALTLLKMAIAFMLDEVSYHSFRLSQIWKLFAAAMLEQIGYRQLLAIWNLFGMAAFYLRLPLRGNRSRTISPFEAPYRPD